MSCRKKPNPNTFASNPLDRASHLRTDSQWLRERLSNPSTLLIPMWRLKPFLLPSRSENGRTDVGWLRPGLLGELVHDDTITIFLGLKNDIAYFAIDISHAPDPEKEGPLAGLGVFNELRIAAPTLEPGDAAILAQAKSMIDWHQRHGFCANCGAGTILSEAGYKRVCHNCRAEHFPRTDPVVIMLALHEDNCLLGRGPKWPRGMYSALAGFLEPGETIEEAVARELMEETGIRVSNVRYHSTQPWPYPSSLMIGCFCDAETVQIAPDAVEIEEARWFHRKDVQAALRGQGNTSFWIPPPMAIAHQLIKSWVFEG